MPYTHTTEVGKTYQTWHKHFFETCDEQSQVHILQIPVNGFSNDYVNYFIIYITGILGKEFTTVLICNKGLESINVTREFWTSITLHLFRSSLHAQPNSKMKSKIGVEW